MSIKVKLSLFVTCIVVLIITLNTTLSYDSSRDALRRETVSRMGMTAKEIGIAVENAEYTSHYIEDEIGIKLRLAAIAAEQELDPDISNVTNEQLTSLSNKLGVSQISLFKQDSNDIRVVKSSDSKEINLSSKDWSFWHAALQQLFAHHHVDVAEGQSLLNYWSGPLTSSITDPSHKAKRGYYYDGSTNYIIAPLMQDVDIVQFDKIFGAQSVLQETMQSHKELLDITGFNPRAASSSTEILQYMQSKIIPQSDLLVLFGSYKFKDQSNDLKLINKAYLTNQIVTTELNIEGKHVIKSFIPVSATHPYVISLVIDYGEIQGVLNKQLYHQIQIGSIFLILVIIISLVLVSYSIRPLYHILRKVNEIAEGHFDSDNPIRANNEWGILSTTIHKMSQNLKANTMQLRQTNEELRNTKQYLESFVNRTPDAFVVAGLDGVIQQANKAYLELYGWSMEETIGFLPHAHTEAYIYEAAEVMRKVKAGIAVHAFESVCQTKDGRLIDVSTTISGILDEQDELVAYASISRDITERRHTDELLRRSEKLSIVGQLAAGVAHEIRNPLTTLRGFVQLQHAKAKGKQLHLEIMLSELDRINFIVSEFLILAKPQAINYQRHDLIFILQDIMSLLDSQANLNNIQFRFDAAPHIPLINCEENQLKQVFINIIKNGMEAMPDGGEIAIQVGNLASADVLVTVIDQGFGIPEDQLARVGEPFYTNKETGTGLGLMVSQQIIANHKGIIRINSEINKGTAVEIILPVG